jgi:hypothetical protein
MVYTHTKNGSKQMLKTVFIVLSGNHGKNGKPARLIDAMEEFGGTERKGKAFTGGRQNNGNTQIFKEYNFYVGYIERTLVGNTEYSSSI